MSTDSKCRALLAGIGNEFRGDDAVGLLVAERVRRLNLPEVEILELGDNLDRLLDLWLDRELVVLVDAVRSSKPLGTLISLDLLHETPPHALTASSTHALDPLQLVRMAKILNQLPQRLHLIGIESANFAIGSDMCDEVRAALPHAVETVLALFQDAGIK